MSIVNPDFEQSPWAKHQPVGLMMAGITTGTELTINERKT